MNLIIKLWSLIPMRPIFKLLFLFLLITSTVFGQIRPDGIRLTNPGYIIGPNGDTIRNSAPNVWNFSNDTLKNVIVPGLETVSLAKNTYWVSPTFPNGGRFFNSIQMAIDSSTVANNDSNRVTIIIFSGNYKGFDCNKSYITFLGLGDVKIDSNLNIYQLVNFTGYEIKMKNITFTNRRIGTVDVPYFRVLYTTGSMELDNVNIDFENFINLYIDNNYQFVGFAFQNTSGNIVMKNCNINTKVIFLPDPPQIYPIYVESISVLASGYSDVSFYSENCVINSIPVGSEFATINAVGYWFTSPTSTTPFKFLIKNSNIFISEDGLYGFEIPTFTERLSVKSDSYVNLFGVISNSPYAIDTTYNSTYNVLIDPNYKIF